MGLKVSIYGTTVKVVFSDDSCTETINACVGGFFEFVALSETLSMWVNDDGKCRGLPINDAATKIWMSYYGATDVIVGDVFFTGGSCPESGEMLGLSDEQVNELVEMAAESVGACVLGGGSV